MSDKLVIGLDSSTQSTKAIAWDNKGVAQGEGRAPISMSRPQAGHAEQSIEDWWSSACSALQELSKQIDPERIAAIAISNQRETVGFIDEKGNASYPAIVWLDERATGQIEPLNAAFPDNGLHKITGKPADITPVIYRLAWMQDNAGDALAETAKIVDVHSFLVGRLTGTNVASYTSADPFGVFDIRAMEWSSPILSYLGLKTGMFPAAVRPGTVVGQVSANAQHVTGLPEGTPVVAAGGDGQCAGLGVNAIQTGRVYLNLGTAIVVGAKSTDPALSNNWRTMVSPTGEGYFLEGVLRGGAFFVDWFVKNFVNDLPSAETFAGLEEGAAALPLGAEGLTICPYLAGVMNPHWNPNARAAFIGLGAHHTKYHVYRAILESLTIEVARCVEAMQSAGHKMGEIIAVGGGANSRLWSQMVADACGLPLIKSRTIEASALGAGISAAVGIGWYESFESASAAMVSDGDSILPDPARKANWDTLSLRQAASYPATNTGVFATT